LSSHPFNAGVQRSGSAALDLAHVACGRLDGYWEESAPWDIAAGVVLLEEAEQTTTLTARPRFRQVGFYYQWSHSRCSK